MDVKEMREVAQAVSEHTACGCDPSVGVVHCPSCDARYLAKLMLVLTNPDPLTLDAAVQVMGREPDGVNDGTAWWNRDGRYVSVRIDQWGSQARIGEWIKYNPTIGQFACLVAAARMGEKS